MSKSDEIPGAAGAAESGAAAGATGAATPGPEARGTPSGGPEPFRIWRVFAAPKELVFKAWSSAEHVSRWFCPNGYTVPQAKVEMRAGGAFEVCMRAPDGTEHWTRGTFVEVTPFTRLVIDMHAVDAQARPLFRAWTEVSLTDGHGGTRMEVVQKYTLIQPAPAIRMVKGAPIGWGQTLDKLQAEITRQQRGERSAAHDTFRVERTYPVAVEQVWRAWADPEAKARWFGGEPAQWEVLERSMDFRVGGSDRLRGRWGQGVVSCFDAVYHDILPNERIVYGYVMHLDDRKISVSLATVEFGPAGPGRTRLRVTEQAAYLDGYDDGGSRARGTGILLDRLGEILGS